MQSPTPYYKSFHFLLHLLLGSLIITTTISLSPNSNLTKRTIMTQEPRIAVVTGANKGIGFHIALQLAQSGLFSNVILACRDKTRGLAAQEQIQTHLLSSSTTENTVPVPPVEVSYEPLSIGDEQSHDNFSKIITEKYNSKVHVLINNAAIAFKNNDPTPFEQQCKPTLDVNFYGTVDFTEKMIPFLRNVGKNNNDARIVNVASMAGRIKQIKNLDLRNKFMNENLTREELFALVKDFEQDVLNGTYSDKGWGKSNYGMSKLSLIAMTKVWARDEECHGIKVNCCCPGYCDTDMTSHNGPRPPQDGARNAVIPATMEIDQCPTGELFSDYQIGSW